MLATNRAGRLRAADGRTVALNLNILGLTHISRFAHHDVGLMFLMFETDVLCRAAWLFNLPCSAAGRLAIGGERRNGHGTSS